MFLFDTASETSTTERFFETKDISGELNDGSIVAAILYKKKVSLISKVIYADFETKNSA